MSSTLKKRMGIIATIICYYLVREGTHLVAAFIMGTFKSVKIKFPGVQVVADVNAMTNFQLAVFCIVGPLTTIVFGYALVLMTKQILKFNNKVVKVIFYCVTFGMLVCDPIYLSVLCGFFGGGDMNGILLFGIPEIVVPLAFGVIGIINVFIFVKYVNPAYKFDFSQGD